MGINVLPFVPGYTHYIYDSGRESAFIMLVAFLITFLCARGYTRLARTHGWGSASFGGVHTHHLVFGMVMAFIAGAVQFAFTPEPGWFSLSLAAVFGAGAALVLDEFALLFHLKDVYWEREGRKSIDAVIIATLFGILFLLHTTPFGSTQDLSGGILALTQVVNLGFVVAAALKGKIFLATFGVFVPVLAIVAAVRLAEPSSIWSRKRYRQDSKKLKRSIARYQKYDRIWKPRRERLHDILGGKTGRPQHSGKIAK